VKKAKTQRQAEKADKGVGASKMTKTKGGGKSTGPLATADASASGGGGTSSSEAVFISKSALQSGAGKQVDIATEQPASNKDDVDKVGCIAKSMRALEYLCGAKPGAGVEVHEHPPCKDMTELGAAAGHLGAILVKNLVFKAKKKRPGTESDSQLWLVCVRSDAKVDIKVL